MSKQQGVEPARKIRDHIKRTDTADAFIPVDDDAKSGVHTTDDLAESLGEEFVRTATTGESAEDDAPKEGVDEETGAPLIKTAT